MIAVAVLLLALPLRDYPPPTAPNLTGRCSFGELWHSGGHIRITGPAWTATGTVEDRWVKIVWRNHDGRVSVGAYWWTADDWLEGVYGHADGAWFDIDGVAGDVTAERFRVRLE